MAKKISIIIPCYNVEKYLMRCIDSLKMQTLGMDEMEWILVNDASTDGTWNLIQTIEKMYPQIVIAVNCEENGRQGRARNIGLEYATAECIGYVDSDDWVEPDMFEAMLREIEENHEDIVYCKCFRDKGVGKMQHKLDGSIKRLNINTEDKRKEFILSNCIGYGVWDKVFRKEFLVEHEVYFPEKVAYEDIFFMSLCYLYAESVGIINYEYYHYFVNEQSTVLRKNAEYHDDILKVTKARWEEYQKRNVWDRYQKQLECDMIMSGYYAAMKVIFMRYDKVPYEMFLQVKQFFNEKMPNASQNPYVREYAPEKYQILLELLTSPVTKEELEQIGELFRRI